MEVPTLLGDLHWTPLEGPGILGGTTAETAESSASNLGAVPRLKIRRSTRTEPVNTVSGACWDTPFLTSLRGNNRHGSS